jgi:hypothetical protein
MGQNVHAGHKTSSVAALAASAIVHCQLSIVNFSEFCNYLFSFATSTELIGCAEMKPATRNEWMAKWRAQA